MLQRLKGQLCLNQFENLQFGFKNEQLDCAQLGCLALLLCVLCRRPVAIGLRRRRLCRHDSVSDTREYRGRALPAAGVVWGAAASPARRGRAVG